MLARTDIAVQCKKAWKHLANIVQSTFMHSQSRLECSCKLSCMLFKFFGDMHGWRDWLRNCAATGTLLCRSSRLAGTMAIRLQCSTTLLKSGITPFSGKGWALRPVGYHLVSLLMPSQRALAPLMNSSPSLQLLEQLNLARAGLGSLRNLMAHWKLKKPQMLSVPL
jgi:hypothetical protein